MSENDPQQSTPNLDESLSVYQILMILIEQLSQIAWQKMGLQPDPITHKIEKNLKESKVAIDAASQLSALLEPELELDEDKKGLHSLMRDLKINYVEQLQQSGQGSSEERKTT